MFNENTIGWPPKRVSWATLLVLVGVALVVSYKFTFITGKKQINELRAQIESLSLEKEKLELLRINTVRDYQRALEAQKNLGNYLHSLQRQNTELTQDVALYQTVSGKSWDQTVQIKTFQIFLTKDPQTFRYALMLSRKAAGQETLHGKLLMRILGRIGDMAIEIPVNYVNSSGLKFKFTHFQELTGELALPQGFEPQQVLFKLTQEGWPDSEQTFPWIKVA